MVMGSSDPFPIRHLTLSDLLNDESPLSIFPHDFSDSYSFVGDSTSDLCTSEANAVSEVAAANALSIRESQSNRKENEAPKSPSVPDSLLENIFDREVPGSKAGDRFMPTYGYFTALILPTR
jgi:hypothetical protein